MDIHEHILRINRDPEAFSWVVAEYEAKLMRYIMRISDIGYADAENLLQEIFIRIYRNINGYDARWSFSGWVYRIARNAVIDEYRSRRERSSDVSFDDEEYAQLLLNLTDGSSPDKELRRSDVRDCVNRAINALPMDYREAIVLRYLEGRSYEEISDILEVPIGTASTLVNRAKARLRETFEKLRCAP